MHLRRDAPFETGAFRALSALPFGESTRATWRVVRGQRAEARVKTSHPHPSAIRRASRAGREALSLKGEGKCVPGDSVASGSSLV
jgi:hypothetical protein